MVYLRYVHSLEEIDGMCNFGNSIVLECVHVTTPELSKKIEVISWYSGGYTQHVVMWVPGWLEGKLLKYNIIAATTRVVNILINHDTGEVKLKGNYHRNNNRISLNACTHLADPDSFKRIGKMIARCMMGKGDLHIG
jgi:hypothetical protein